MLGSSTSAPGTPLSTDTTQLLQQIARNTTETLRWLKYLVGAVVILVIVTGLLLI